MQSGQVQIEGFDDLKRLSRLEVQSTIARLQELSDSLWPSPESSDLARVEVGRAVAKFPTWPTDPFHAYGVLAEEFGELGKAIVQYTYEPHKNVSIEDIRAEAVQTAAMALRFLQSVDMYRFDRCPQHEQ